MAKGLPRWIIPESISSIINFSFLTQDYLAQKNNSMQWLSVKAQNILSN